MLITETFFKRFATTKNARPTSKRKRYGTFLSRSYAVLKLCMTERSSTETWNQPTYSFTETCKRSLVIWTCLKSSRKVWAILRQEHLTTLVLKSGVICLTIQRVTSGRLVAFYTKCVLLSPRFELMTCKGSIKKWLKANIRESLSTSVKKWPPS